MDIYDQKHMDAMFYFCNDNQDEYLEFCARNNYISDIPMRAFCQSRESEYIDFLEHYELM